MIRKDQPGWTVDLLKEDVDQRLKDLQERVGRQIATQERARVETKAELSSDLKEMEKYLSAMINAESMRSETALGCVRGEASFALISQEKATTKAETATEKRFEAVNEFRAQLTDQAATFMPREVAESQFAELRKQLGSNTDRLNERAGQEIGHDKYFASTSTIISTVIASLAVLASILILLFSHPTPKQGFTCVPSSAVAKTTMVCK